MVEAILAFWSASEQYWVVWQKALHSEVMSQVFNLFAFFCRYLEVEWEAKRKTHREFNKSTMIDLYPRVPKQNNSSDCGVYLLQYVESFLQVQTETFPFPKMMLNPRKLFLTEITRHKNLWRSASKVSKQLGEEEINPILQVVAGVFVSGAQTVSHLCLANISDLVA